MTCVVSECGCKGRSCCGPLRFIPGVVRAGASGCMAQSVASDPHTFIMGYGHRYCALLLRVQQDSVKGMTIRGQSPLRASASIRAKLRQPDRTPACAVVHQCRQPLCCGLQSTRIHACGASDIQVNGSGVRACVAYGGSLAQEHLLGWYRTSLLTSYDVVAVAHRLQKFMCFLGRPKTQCPRD